MQKIISLFKRDYLGTHLVFDEIVPDAAWVIAGEGIATVKWDGTACRITQDPDGRFIIWKRYDVKKGRMPPEEFEAAQTHADSTTGHWPGWLKCSRSNPSDKWHFEAFDAMIEEVNDQEEAVRRKASMGIIPGTYELIGPKIGNKGGGNPYGLTRHVLVMHGNVSLFDVPRTFEGLRAYFIDHPAYEGIVFWKKEGDETKMVKIKRRDFGLPWPQKEQDREDGITQFAAHWTERLGDQNR